MKYWIGKMQERNGEYAYTQRMLIEAESRKEAEVRLEARASMFYSEFPTKKEEGGYYFNSGEVHVSVIGVQEISRPTFKELQEAW